MLFIVHGSSMESTYREGDRLFVSRILYLVTSPGINDVVVVKDPRDGRLLLKRITKIIGGKYFVEGDNPDSSTDSRTFGEIERENILGKVFFRYKKAL